MRGREKDRGERNEERNEPWKQKAEATEKLKQENKRITGT